MHRALSSKWLRSALSISGRGAVADIPVFLCPAVGLARQSWAHATQVPSPCRYVHSEATASKRNAPLIPVVERLPPRRLPLQCTGCGAFAQTSDPNVAGYYDRSRKAVRLFLGEQKERVDKDEDGQDDLVVQKALESLGNDQLEKLGLSPNALFNFHDLESGTLTSMLPNHSFNSLQG
jgi:genetic interactor of prohibitins 3, mitochondrial